MATSSVKKPTSHELVKQLAPQIRGKVVLTTGVSPGGLGAYFVQAIAQGKPKLLILAARTLSKAEETAKRIAEEAPDVKTRLLRLDLASLSQVRDAAKEVNAYPENIDVLVNNAGIMAVPYSKTVDGFEAQLASNHLGPFLFTNLIMQKVLASGPGARIVNVSSDGHRFGHIRYLDYNFHDGESYNQNIAYGQSKTANMLFSWELAKRLGPQGLLSFSLHPGVIMTNLPDHLSDEEFASFTEMDKQLGMKQGWEGFDFVEPDVGTATHVVTAFAPDIKDKNGRYFEKCEAVDLDDVHPWTMGDREARKCWALSERLVGQQFPYNDAPTISK